MLGENHKGKFEGTEKGKVEEKSDKKKPKDGEEVKSRWKKSKKKTTTTTTTSQNVLPSTVDDSKITEKDDEIPEKEEEPPFSFSDLRFEVPKGAFVAIVGRVGCGKVSWGS